MQPRLVECSEPPSPDLLAHLPQPPVVAPARLENEKNGRVGFVGAEAFFLDYYGEP